MTFFIKSTIFHPGLAWYGLYKQFKFKDQFSTEKWFFFVPWFTSLYSILNELSRVQNCTWNTVALACLARWNTKSNLNRPFNFVPFPFRTCSLRSISQNLCFYICLMSTIKLNNVHKCSCSWLTNNILFVICMKPLRKK